MKKKVYAYLHTHWDREWYRNKEEFNLRFLEVFDIVLDELKANEIEHVLYYDLTRPELDVNVVRVIIPTMELYSIDPSRAGYRFLRV